MADGEAVITEEMIKEEQELQEGAAEKEALRTRNKRELSREESLARLQCLLRASNCYSQFLFERIQQQKQERAVRPQKTKLQEIDRNCLSSAPEKEKSKRAKRQNRTSPEQQAKRMRGKTSEAQTTTCSEDGNGEKVAATNCEEAQPALFTGGVLRPYQIEGFNWLKLLCENGVNGILGDEMGLGKTAQLLALMAHLMERGVRGPFLVVGPLSAVPQWVTEAKRFVPTMSSLLYHGPERRKQRPEKLGQINLVVTSYEVAMRDASLLAKVAWRLLVVDEGHRLKNASCRLARSLRLLRTDGRILLTGTPLQNNLAELWALLHFLLPEIFSDVDAFQSWFDVDALRGGDDGEARLVAQEQQDHVITTMQEILNPFLLRRTKEEVCIQLPRKKEVLVWAPMSPLQQEYYTACVNRSIELLLAGGRGSHPEDDTPTELNLLGRPKRRVAKGICYEQQESDISECSEDEPETEVVVTEKDVEEPVKEILRVCGDRNPLMDLRKICSHPYLVRCPLEDELIPCNEELVQNSGKLRLLDAMLLQLKKRGHKVLLFSQMTRMLDLLEVYCSLRKFQYCRLDGNVRAEERQPRIDLFNSDARKFVFLLSTRAGGLGLNLTSADTVVLYDSDWNPQCDAQASARCHRIGQTRPVVVYRLVMRGTVDQRMVEMATAKRKLERLIIQKGKFSFKRTTGRSVLSPQELLELLKSTDTSNVVHADSPVLSCENLEALLDRSETLSSHEGVFQLVKDEEEDITDVR